MKRVFKVYISKAGNKPYFVKAVKDNAFYQHVKNGEWYSYHEATPAELDEATRKGMPVIQLSMN